ncbi:hypothetical protein TIFTF001_016789 [Ficus carica]|uniref:DUF1985 domain-containing protein n=1 Tax=Ficus carica TaxID=3494 RepID=A0AA88A9E1_FICCA|nr:hypothetical protein TIFTF001_016789 [Ficus carica]
MGEESSKTTQIQSKILESPMSKPMTLTEKNITPEKRSFRVMASAEKRPSREKNPKKLAPEKKRRVPEEGLKRKQGEIEVKESKKAKRTLEENKNSDVEEVLHNIVMRLTDHLGMGSTYLALAVDNQLMSRYFSTLRAVSREHLEVQLSNAKLDNDNGAVKLGLLYMIFCIPLANANSIKIDRNYFALADNLVEFNAFPWGVLS